MSSNIIATDTTVIHIPKPEEYKNMTFTVFNAVQDIMMPPGTIVVGVSYTSPNPVLVCLSPVGVKSDKRTFGFVKEGEYLKPNTKRVLGTVKDYIGKNLIIVEYD